MQRKKEIDMLKKVIPTIISMIVIAANSMAINSLSEVSLSGWYQPEIEKEVLDKVANMNKNRI